MTTEEARKHFIGMAGLHGYIPNYCDVYASYDGAVEGLCQIHDLGKYSKFRKELKKFGYTELRLYSEQINGGFWVEGHGNEYAQIVECECAEPWVHSDSGESPFEDLPSPAQLQRYASYESQARWPGSLT